MDRSRNHIEALKKRIADLDRIIALNNLYLAEYGEYVTPEYIEVIKAQNDALELERTKLEEELEEYES